MYKMAQNLEGSKIQNSEFLEEIQGIMDEAPDLYEALANDKFE